VLRFACRSKTAWRWLNVPRWCPVREAHGIPFRRSTEAERQRFGKAVIDGTLAVAHFRALFEKFHNFRVGVKPFGHANKAFGDFRKLLGREAGIDFVRGVITAVLVRRPVIRQFCAG